MRALVLAVAVATVAAVPAAAAPTLTVDRGCYPMDRDDVITFTGTGFTPHGEVAVMLHGHQAGYTYRETANAAGGVKLYADVPWLEDLGFGDSWRQTIAATAVDVTRASATPPDAPNALVSTTVTITNWGVEVAPWNHTPPAPGHPRRMATFAIKGWTWVHGQPIYAHYILKGKLIRTIRLAVPQGPCGDAVVQMREFPFRPVHPGIYRVQFDHTAALRPPGWEYASYYWQVRVAPKYAVR